MKRLVRFLDQLKAHRDAEGQPLLDTTSVLFGSGMGDANTHDNSNLPTLLVGGGWRHGAHHRIDRGAGNRLLGDLYLTLMQRMGVKVDAFAGAKSNLNEVLL